MSGRRCSADCRCNKHQSFAIECASGCRCGKHRTLTAAERARKATAVSCLPGCTCRKHHAPPGAGSYNFSGGDTGKQFAALLSPAGFVREYVIQYGLNKNEAYHLDFAHVAGKVCIELDGPYHVNRNDSARDSWLKSRGWKVIRIKHC